VKNCVTGWGALILQTSALDLGQSATEGERVQPVQQKKRTDGRRARVHSSEPPSPNNPLLRAKDCFVTAHIAWASKEARTRLLDTVIANLRASLDPSRQRRELSF